LTIQITRFAVGPLAAYVLPRSLTVQSYTSLARSGLGPHGLCSSPWGARDRPPQQNAPPGPKAGVSFWMTFSSPILGSIDSPFSLWEEGSKGSLCLLSRPPRRFAIRTSRRPRFHGATHVAYLHCARVFDRYLVFTEQKPGRWKLNEEAERGPGCVGRPRTTE
jgi:hypothetical protein